MNAQAIPDWAKEILREPDSLSELEWKEDEVISSSGRRYKIDNGIPIFQNHEDSYQNLTSSRPKVDRQNPTIRAFEDNSLIFNDFAESIRNKTVVDMCSGGGMPSYYLAAHYGCRVISIERAYNALKHYGDLFRDYYNIKDDQVVRICGDAARLPLSHNSVDVVLGSSWVHHFGDKVKLLRGAYQVLKPGGILLAHNEGVAGVVKQATSDEDQYVSRSMYKRAMKEAGFGHVKVTPFSRWYWLVWWIRGSVDVSGIRV